MPEPTRDELFRLLGELCHQQPNIRVGQLIANLSYLARGPSNESVWDVEDEELLAAAKAQINAASRHTPLA